MLAALDADVIAIQEIDKRFGRRENTLKSELIEGCTDYKFVPVPTPPQSAGWYGNGLLVKPWITTDNIRIKKLPSLEPRGALAADIYMPCKQRRVFAFRLVCVHLALMTYWRRKQIKVIMQDLLPDKLNIIAGDFNTSQRGSAICEDVLGSSCTIVEPGPSFHSAWPQLCLDKFLITGSADYSIMRSGVLHDPLSCRASDHLPVWMDIDL